MLIRSLFACCSLVGYSIKVSEASPSAVIGTNDAFLEESCNTSGRSYVGKCREIDDPRRQSPSSSRSRRSSRSYESSPKMSGYQRKQLLNERQINGKSRGERCREWERRLVRNLHRRHENRVEESRSYERSGRRSSNREPPHLRSSSARTFYWEPIFDGIIIATIGNLFPKNTKDESNRERIEREEVRKNHLLQKYTNMLNDPVKLSILKSESKNSPTYINQRVRRFLSPNKLKKSLTSR